MLASRMRQTEVSGGDPNFANVSLLLHMDGTNGSTTFTDSSSNNLSVTASNATISTTQTMSGFGQSAYLNGSNSYLSIATNSLFAMGAGQFSIEFWFYPTASKSNAGILDMRSTNSSSSGILIRMSDGTSVFCYLGNPSTTTTITNSNLILNAWNYVALTRDASNNVRVYINGVSGSTVSSTVNLTDQSFLLGRFVDTGALSNSASGYYDDLRITKSVARTISTPTAPFPNS